MTEKINHILVLENIRSAYNTGVMLRTCDGLGRKAVLSGFTPRPEEEGKVGKTALGAEKEVIIGSFWNPKEARDRCRTQGYLLVASEKTATALPVNEFGNRLGHIALIMGNENTGVLPETLAEVDYILHISMQGMKESLNVAEAASIMMWELSR